MCIIQHLSWRAKQNTDLIDWLTVICKCRIGYGIAYPVKVTRDQESSGVRLPESNEYMAKMFMYTPASVTKQQFDIGQAAVTLQLRR